MEWEASVEIVNILQAVYYTLVIIGAAFGVSKAVGISLKAASTAMAQSTTAILESHGNVIKTLTEHQAKHLSMETRIKQLENSHQSQAANMIDLKDMFSTMSKRIDKIFDILTTKKGNG